MNIAVIAPNGATPLTPEEVEIVVSTLSDQHKIVLFQSQVTERKLLSNQTSIDWVWVCSHTVERGIILSDRFLWNTNLFARWLVNVEAKLVILNSCYSVQLVSEIQRYCNIDVVATILPEGIEDSEGAINAIYLSKQIVAKGENIEEALRVATGNGVSQYRLFRMNNYRSDLPKNKEKSDEVNMLEILLNRVSDLEKQVLNIEVSLKSLERIIRGDPDLQVSSIQTQLSDLKRLLNEKPTNIVPVYDKGTIVLSLREIVQGSLVILLLFIGIVVILKYVIT